MIRIQRLRRPVTTGIAALLLATALATDAGAATQRLIIKLRGESVQTIEDPILGECYFVSMNAESTHNDTNSTALFFNDSFCDPDQFHIAVQPGGSESFGIPRPLSVRVGGPRFQTLTATRPATPPW